RADYFPHIKNDSGVSRITDLQNIDIPAGAFGVLPNAGGFITNPDIPLRQGNPTLVTSATTAPQLLTPLIRIHAANRIAASEIVASRDDLKNVENQVALKIHQVYYGILSTRLQKLAAEQEAAYSKTHLRESEEDIRNGNALKVTAIEGQA